MALIENANSFTSAAHATARRSFLGRRNPRRALAPLAHYPARLLRDMGLDPEVVPTDSWDFHLGEPQAIGNRP